MCWNSSVSINTYIFNLFACIFAYMNGVLSLPYLLFIQSYSIIQLIEYFIWTKTLPNRLLSQIALVIICMQPIFCILTIEEPNRYVIPYALIVYVLLMSVFLPTGTFVFVSKKASNGHLAWYWLQPSLPLFLIWFFFLLMPFILNKLYVMAIIIVITIFVIYILYSDTLTWGSIWCWIANFISIYLIYLVFCKELCK
jgi:hypothetical protein